MEPNERCLLLINDRITDAVETAGVTLPPIDGDVTVLVLATRVSVSGSISCQIQRRTAIDPDEWENVAGGSFAWRVDELTCSNMLRLKEKLIGDGGVVRAAIATNAPGSTFDVVCCVFYKPSHHIPSTIPGGGTQTTPSGG